MNGFLCDVRQAWRNARRAPGRTLILVLSLAFGLGAVATMFSVCDGLLFRPPPFAGAERQYWAGRVGKEATVEYRLDQDEFRMLRRQAKTLEDMVGYCYLYMVMRAEDTPRYVSGAFLPANVFEFLGIKPFRGRGFLPGEDEAGAADVCIISYELWQRQFGGLDDVVGRSIVLDEIPRTIVGVTPPDSDFPRHFDLWIPLKFTQLTRAVSWSRGATLIVKLRPGVTQKQATAELELIGARIQAAYPGKYPHPWKLQLSDRPRDNNRRTPELLLRYGSLLGVAILVLVIACANVANLLLVEAARRSHDLTVRSALGASRSRLIRQMLVESLLLTITGTAVGLFFSHEILDFLWASLATIDEPNWMRFRLSLRVFALAFATMTLVGTGVGLLPAWRASRLDLVQGLKDGARTASTLQLGRVSRILVILQIGLACAVLTAGTVSLGSILLTTTKLLPFNPDQFLMIRVQIRDRAYPTVADRSRFFSQFLRVLRSDPAIADAVATSRQLDGPPGAERVGRTRNRGLPTDAQPRALGIVCTPGYFSALGVSLLRGRDFTTADVDGRQPVCMINTLLADRLFHGEDPIGKNISIADVDSTVVGLVPDLREQGLNSAVNDVGGACIYRPQAQAGFDFLSVIVRPKAGTPASVLRNSVDALRRIDSRVSVFEAAPWGGQIEQGLRFTRFLYRLSLGFGIAALLLAGVGVYAVVAFSTEQRTREIGIRMALGAIPRDVLRMIACDGTWQIAAGLLVGSVASYCTAQVLLTVVYPFPTGILKYAVALGTVATIAAVSVFLPALRSSRLDPVKVLRG
jgi:putative ABC transport system permease protein